MFLYMFILKKGSPNLCTYVWKHTNKQNRMAKVNSTNNKRVMNIWDIRSLANLKLEMLLVDSDVVVDTLPFLCTTKLLSSVFVISVYYIWTFLNHPPKQLIFPSIALFVNIILKVWSVWVSLKKKTRNEFHIQGLLWIIMWYFWAIYTIMFLYIINHQENVI